MENLYSKIELKGTIDKKWVEGLDKNGNKIDLGFKEFTLKVKDEPETGSTSITKSKNGAIDFENKTQSYTIKVTSSGTNHEVDIEDHMGTDLTFDNGSIQYYKDADLTQPYDKTATVVQSSEHDFKVRVAEMENNEELYISYKVHLSEQLFDDLDENGRTKGKWSPSDTNSNVASVKSKETTTPVVTSNEPVNTSISLLSKYGYYDKTQKTINWNIQVNVGSDKVDLNGAVLKDLLQDNLVQFPDNTSVTVTNTTKGTSTTIQGSELKNGYAFPKGSDSYTITYATPIEENNIPSKGYTTSVQNKANINYHEKEYSVVSSVKVGDDSQKLISKTAGEFTKAGNNTVLAWTTTIEIPAGGLKDVVLSDNTSVRNGDGQAHWILPDTIKALLGSTPVSVTSVEKPDNSYEFSLGDVPNPGSAPVNLVITYQTILGDNTGHPYEDDLSNHLNQTTEYVNKVSLSAKDKNSHPLDEQTAEASKKYNLLLKKSYNSALYWDSVYQAQFPGIDVWNIVIDKDKLLSDIGDASYVIVTDTIPEGLTYTDGTIQPYVTDSTNTNFGITPSIDGNVVSWKIPIEKIQNASGNIRIQLDTTITGDYDKWDENKDYTNQADVYIGDSTTPAGTTTAVGKQKKPAELIKKDVKYNTKTAPNAEFTVLINPEKAYLVDKNPHTVIQVEDTLGSSFTYNRNTLEVQINDGDFLPIEKLSETDSRYTCHFDSSTNKLLLTVPDGIKIRLKYSARVNESPGTSVQDGSNTVRLTGIKSDKGIGHSETIATAVQSAGSAGTEDMRLSVYKHEKGNEEKPLSNAEFELYELNYDKSTNKVIAVNELFDEQKSSDTGYASFKTLSTDKKLIYDSVYKLVEKKAPDGYELEKNPVYLVFPSEETFENTIIGEDGKTYPLKQASINAKYFQVAFPNTPTGVESTEEVITQTRGNLTIHKYDYSGTDGVPGTGEIQTNQVPDGAVGLDGVTFKIYKVAEIVQENHSTKYKLINDTIKLAIGNSDDYITPETNGNIFVDTETGDIKSSLGTIETYTGITATVLGNPGIAEFQNLPVGLYLVVETDAPPKVTKRCEPFFVSVPSTKADGSSWNYNVHVYPKNTTNVGQVILKKKDKNGYLSGSKFKLYKKIGAAWVVQTKDADNAAFDSGVFDSETTNFTVPADGLALNNLSIGEYKFVESSAPVGSEPTYPVGYIADRKTEHIFQIKQGDKSIYDSTDTKIENNTIEVVNELPSIQKKVLKNGGSTTKPEDWMDTADYSTTKQVKFKVTVDIPTTIDDLKTFQIQDRFRSGIFSQVTFESATCYSEDEVVVTSPITSFVVDYDTTAPSKEIGWSMNLTKEQKLALKHENVSRMEIIYSATLTKQAVTAGDGNENEAKLEYSNQTTTWSIPDKDKSTNPPSDETTEINDKAFVYTFGLKVDKKFDGVDDDNRAGYVAKFDVYVKDTNSSDTIPGTEIAATKIGEYATDNGILTIHTSLEEDKAFAFSNGTYYLVETKTADGYNLLKEPMTVSISVNYKKESYQTERITRVYDSDNSVTESRKVLTENKVTEYTGSSSGAIVTGTDGMTTVNVVNKKGFTLPVTGGKGTKLFTIIGLGLMVAAVVGFFGTKKKRSVVS